MPARLDRPVCLLRVGPRREPAGSRLTRLIDDRLLKPLVRQPADCPASAAPGRCRRAQTGSPPDGEDGARHDLPSGQYRREPRCHIRSTGSGPACCGTWPSSERTTSGAPTSTTFQCAGLSLSRRGGGLGNAQGDCLVAVEHDGTGLLRRGAQGGPHTARRMNMGKTSLAPTASRCRLAGTGHGEGTFLWLGCFVAKSFGGPDRAPGPIRGGSGSAPVARQCLLPVRSPIST